MMTILLNSSWTTAENEQCLVARNISRQPHLIALTCVTVLSCIFGVITSALLAYYLYKKPVYHINIRLLMWNMCVALVLLMFGIAYLSMHNLVDFALYENEPCRLLISYSECHIRRSLSLILPTFVSGNNMLAMAIERGYATYYYRTYESHQSVRTAVVFILIQWGVGAVPPLINYMKKVDDALIGTMPYCISLLITPGSALFIVQVKVFLALASVTYVLRLLIVNSRNHRRKVCATITTTNGGRHLSERYQLAENVRTTRILFPQLVGGLLLDCALMVSTVYVMESGRLDNDADVARLAIFNELVSLLLTLWAPTFCITCIVRSPKLLAYVRSQWPCLSSATPQHSQNAVGQSPNQDATELHMQQLQAYWENHVREQQGQKAMNNTTAL